MLGMLYCATPLAIKLNVWSNLVIIGFGIAALFAVRKRATSSRDLWLLSSLLLLTGLSSLYWHALGTSSGLVLDSGSAIIFMLVFAYLWMGRVWPPGKTHLVFSAFVILEILSAFFSYYFLAALRGFMFVPLAPVILIFAAVLIYKSAARAVSAAWLGFSAIASTLLGLVFRSIDLTVCPYFPLGTHFLWHILVSVGAYLAVLTLLELDKS